MVRLFEWLSRRNETVIILGGLAVFVVCAQFVGSIYGAIWPPPPAAPPTAAEIHAREDAEARRVVDEAARARKYARDQGLCDRKFRCYSYSRARQDCATAGDFGNCMGVKLDDYPSLRKSCTGDGNLSAAPADMPNVAECALMKVGVH